MGSQPAIIRHTEIAAIYTYSPDVCLCEARLGDQIVSSVRENRFEAVHPVKDIVHFGIVDLQGRQKERHKGNSHCMGQGHLRLRLTSWVLAKPVL
jgi:hypothetical protein